MLSNSRIIARVVFAAAFVLILSSALFAQSYRGSISGTVTDPTGAVIVGAKVTVTSAATGVVRSAVSDDRGKYLVSELPAGEYEVRIDAVGFATLHIPRRVVSVGRDTQLNALMELPKITVDPVYVGTTAPIVETTHDVLSTVIDNRLVTELPLNGRDFGKLVALVPGVTVEGSGVAGTERGFGQFNINGNRDRSNNYVLDGTDNNDPYFNNSALNQVGITGAPASLLPIDSIQEFNLQSQFGAEYGRNSGSVVNTLTKSGSNQFHGSLFEFLRNNWFDARNYFNTKPNVQSAFRNNQFGGSLGGPIVKGKTFFFGAFEGQRERVGSDFLYYVPTNAQKAAARAAASDYLDGTPNPALDKILAMFPSSTTGTVPASVKDKNDLNSALVKVDHYFTPMEELSVRYAFSDGNQVFPLGSLSGGGGSRLAQFAQQSPTRVQVVSASVLSTLSYHFINELRFGYSRYRTSFTSADSSFDPASIGLNTGTGKLGLPEIDFGGALENLGATGYSIPRGRTSQTYQILDNVTWIRGNHTTKFGAEFRRAAIESYNDNLGRGMIQFAPSGNFDELPPCTGAPTEECYDPVVDVLTNFYTGYWNYAPANSGNTQRTTYSNGFSVFAQDDYHASSKLTLNLGLRWEYFGPISEKNGLLSNLLPNGTLAMVGTNGLDGAYNRNWLNFSPRLGFAWSVSNNTTVRGGYGLYYDSVPQHLFIASYTPTAGIATNPIGPKPVTPLNFDGNAWASGGGPIFTAGSAPYSIFATPRNLSTPYVQNWNLNLQQKLGDRVAFELGYVGSKGTKLMRLINANEPDVNGNYYRNTNYTDIFELVSASGSTYHALQATTRFQGYHGISGLIGYVWSKSLDDASDAIDFTASAALPQDSANLRAEHGPSTFDTRNRFTAALNYQVPEITALRPRFGRGWNLNLMSSVQSGRPIPIITSNDTSANPNYNYVTRSWYHQRPNLVPGVNPIVSNWSVVTGYLNPNAFSQPADGTFGNLARNAIYSAGFWDVDMSLSKNTKLSEHVNLQLRWEVFNVYNHPNFALPNAVWGSGSFGQISQTPDVAQGNPGLGGGGPRVMQLGARLSF
jgi:hypothetical protein